MERNRAVEVLRLRERHSHWVPFVLDSGSYIELGKVSK